MFTKLSRLSTLIIALGASVAAHATAPIVNIQQWQTKNGAGVYFVEIHQLPVVDINVVFHAGSAYDGKQFGVASLTNSLLNQGTSNHDADGIAAGFDNLAVGFSSGSARDMAYLRLRSLSDDKILTPAVNLYAEVLNIPNFPQNEFDRLQKMTLDYLVQREEDPETVASIAFFKQLYGDHPYAHPVDGVKDTVSRLKRDDVSNYYHRYYVAKNAVVVIVGDLTKAKAEQLANTIIAKMPAGEAPAPLPAVVAAKKVVDTIAFPSQQTHILKGQVGIKRGDPAYFPLFVGNYILGGNQLVSRLFEEVRNKHGYVYSIYSSFTPMIDSGPYVIGLQTRADQSSEALKLTDNTFKQFLELGPNATELALAKKSITGNFPLQLDSNASISALVSSIAFYHMPLDYLDTYRANINRVTIADIKSTYNKLFHPEQMVTVMVGKRETHAEQVSQPSPNH